MIRIWTKYGSVVAIFFLLANFLHYFFLNTDVSTPQEVVATYTLSNQYDREVIPHLTPINPSALIPSGSYAIDVAHRRGYLHTGHCMFIMDASGLLLFLKRSSDVVTCPSTWSILGEHSMANEGAYDTVVRGMEEELGLKKQVTRLGINNDFGEVDSSSFSADFQTMTKETIHVAVQNITQYPLYYIRHYGPRLDNRIDSQVTYLWLARLPKRHEEIQIRLDNEVADHKWISVDEFSDWIGADARDDDMEKDGVNTLQHHSEGAKDDGPPTGAFCHRTIRSLYAKGLENLKRMM